MFKPILFFISIVLTIGCKKELQRKINNNKDSILIEMQTQSIPEPDWSLAENSKNALDSVGLIHNQAVWLRNQDTDATFNDQYDSLVQYFSNKWGLGFDAEDFINTYPVTYFDSLLADSINNYENIIGSTDFSSDAQLFLSELVNILLDTTYISQNFIYTDIKDSIMNWEDEVMASTLNSSEIQSLLMVSSIARYSTLYWHDKFIQTENDDPAPTRKRKWWHWLIVGVADVAGAVIGAGVNPGVAVTAGTSASVGAATIINWGQQ